MESVLHAKDFVSPYYDSVFSGKYTLRLLIKSIFASLAVIDSDAGDLLALKHWPLHDTLEDEAGLSLFKNRYFREIGMLQKIYQAVEISWFTKDFILMPSSSSSADKPETYWEKIRGSVSASSCIKNTHCRELDIDILYKVPKNTLNQLEQLFEHMEINHSAGPLLRTLQSMAPPVHKNTFAIINGNILELAVFHNETLLFYNSFQCQEAEDYLYFITWIYRELELSASHSPIFLCGLINRSDPVYNLLHQYFSKIEFADFKHNFNLPKEEDHLMSHSLINLLYQAD